MCCLTTDTRTFYKGCVVAGRLAYADPTLKVMLIEGMFSGNIFLLAAQREPQVVPTTAMIPGSTGKLFARAIKLAMTFDRPGIYVKNMQRDGMLVFTVC
jgi:hypothetical protein